MAETVAPRILVADDDNMLRELLVLLLATEGYAARGVGNLDEARAALDAEPWALILLDTLGAIPSEQAFQAMTSLSDDVVPTPVLVMTGSSITAAWADHNPVFAGVVRKPFELQPFLQLVDKLVSRVQPAPVFHVGARDRTGPG